jgi:peptidoglycan hydrolase-like protein with peptidoglycan-binding domain
MNIAAKNTASKLFVALVAVAMLFTVAAPAKAATVEELQAQIAALMAQISGLSGGSSAPTAGCTFTRALTTGSEGADVTCLQNYLIGGGFGISAGATGYFGSQTASAVASWQAANGVTPAAGYFGPVSQAKYNALVASNPSTPGTDDSDDNDSSDLQGEADLDSAEISSADDDQVEEGAEDAEIAEFKVEFKDGDAEISRLDVSISSTSVDSWDVLEEVSLWVDGDEVARMNADDKDDYLDEDRGTLRFSGLDIVANEDEELTIVIAATIQNNIDSEDMGDFNVSVDTIRFFDADGVATTDDSTGDLGSPVGETVEFTIEEAGFEDEILVKTSSEDPDATTLKVEDDSKSDWLTVFMFDLDTDDSINDIELDSVQVTLDLSAAYNTVVDDAELVIDGTTIDDFTVGSTTAATTTLTFDVDGDVTIDAGDRVGAELKLRFKSLAVEGTTVKASIAGTPAGAVSGEGADDVDSTGGATGDTHTLRSAGLDVTLKSDSSSVTTADGNTNDYATYTLVLEVSAFDQDVFLSTNPATSTAWSLTDGAGNTVSAGTSTVVLTSSADEESGFFRIDEGSTETVTIKVTYVPGVTNTAARLQLGSLKYREVASFASLETWAAIPATDFRTDVETIVN